MASEDFWGDLDGLAILKTPVSILREQADVLSQRTRGILVGEVASINSPYGGVAWDLRVRVPGMNNYVTSIVQINHPITLYPLMNLTSAPGKVSENNVANEERLKQLLKTVFASDGVRNLMGALLSQAQS